MILPHTIETTKDGLTLAFHRLNDATIFLRKQAIRSNERFSDYLDLWTFTFDFGSPRGPVVVSTRKHIKLHL